MFRPPHSAYPTGIDGRPEIPELSTPRGQPVDKHVDKGRLGCMERTSVSLATVVV